MASDIKFILFAFVIITMFLEGEPQLQWQDASFFQQDLMNYLFPKNPGLVRVRRMDQAKQVTQTNDAVVLDFVGMVEQYGYPAEEHNIVTEDGYNLAIHRIPGSPLWKNRGKIGKKIVFLQHGILASSDSWVIFGPGKDLAFLLADQGYDVWIGNVRGNAYGRSHVRMTTYDRKFWEFSFNEMGAKDLPAMIDYILNYTKQKVLDYIGHSMGTTTLFVLLSTKPEYNAKIKIAICLSPIAFWPKIMPAFQQIINFTPRLIEFLKTYKIYDVIPQSLTTVSFGKTFCNDKAITQSLCITLIFLIVGADPAQLNTTALPYLFSHFPAGASVQTFYHYYQNIIIDDFRNYDYGAVDNYRKYRQKTPPSYDIKRITVPTALFYAANDMVSIEENILKLSKYLPNVVLSEEVPFKLFNHADFVWAIDAKTLLYDRVIQVLQKFDANQNLTMQ